jgi:transposase
MDKLDKEESASQKYTKEELEKKMQMLSDRKDYYNDLLDQMKEEGVTQISFTDPDSRLMKTANGGFEVSYNVQIVADPVSHMVGAVEVTNNCNDIGLLSSVTEDLKDTLEVPVMEVVADKGYEQKEDMLECLMNGTIPHVPSKADGDSYELELDYKEAEITEELLASKNSDDIKTCLEAGALPDVYKDKGIEISVHEKDVTSSFTLTEDGAAVICPNGSTLNKAPTINSRGKTRFTNRSACRDCSDKCTTSKFKQVDMNEGQTVLHLKRRHKPDNKIVKKVKIKLTPDMEKISNRKTVVEHPFGTVKHWNDGAHALLTGKRKVGADLSLAFLGYNIKRAINMVGVQELIERMRELIGDISCYFGYFAKFIEKSVSKSIYSSSAA